VGRTPRFIGGRWEIISLLAEGGMGAIYVARHRQTGRQAAVKVIEGDQPEVMARFKLEASVAAEVNHPGIVEVFDADFDPDTSTCFIAMELLRGRTLRALMDDDATKPQEVVELLTLALEPLAAAHAKGYVHRDLKPENIFVVEDLGKQKRVKLLDFGIAAQERAGRLTRSGTTMGTPHYMSPEQATNARAAGPASDIWALGIMLYEAICGDVPFKGETAHAIIVQACVREHEPLESTVTGLDPGLARLVDRCLAKQPEQRPMDAAVLHCELRMLLRPNSLPAARPLKRTSLPTEDASGMRSRALDDDSVALQIPMIWSAQTAWLTSGAVVLSSSAVLAWLDVLAPEAALLLAGTGVAMSAASILHMRKVHAARENTVQDAGPAVTVAQRSRRPMEIRYPARGPEAAPITIELYVDLSLGVTRRICQRVMALRAEHPEQIRIIARPLPDPTREIAWLTAEALRDVFERSGNDAFWHMYDSLLTCTRKVTNDLLLEVAVSAGAEPHELRRALRARLRRRVIAAAREQAVERGAVESPTVFMNGQLLGEDLADDRLRWAYHDALAEVKRRAGTELAVMRTEVAPMSSLRMKLRGVLIAYQGARDAPRALRRTREQARERADKLLARARLPGADFSDLALRFGDRLIELGEVEVSELSVPIQDAVARLAIGEVSDPLERDEGFHVLQRV
jgi:serine/threonine protein kinase